MSLLQDGFLAIQDIYTLRIGEPVYDQILGRPVLLDIECIKIQSVSKATACTFFTHKNNACELYAHRPLECRALQCWDTRALAEVSRSPRLIRFDIIGADSGLAEVIHEHETRCGCDALLTWLNQDSKDARKALQGAKAYDTALRDVLVKRGLDRNKLDFLLGRPLDMVVQGLSRWRDLKA